MLVSLMHLHLSGADTDPRLAIVACQWTTGSQTNILFDASSNVVALSLNGNGAYNVGSQQMPSIPNNAGSGVTGDILLTNGSASVGTIWLKLKKSIWIRIIYNRDKTMKLISEHFSDDVEYIKEEDEKTVRKTTS